MCLSTCLLSTPARAAVERSPRTEAKDTNGDGVPDLWITYEGARPIRLERDLNGDGKPDLWITYSYIPAEPGQPDHKRAEIVVDRNHDGKPDYWRLEQEGVPVREWGDLNLDGRVDNWVWYVDGRKQWVVMDKNDDGLPDAWFYYGEHGEGAPGGTPGMSRPVAGEIDENFDGKPDRSFGTLPTPPTLEGTRPPFALPRSRKSPGSAP